MEDILSGTTNIITNISYIYNLIADAKRYGLKQIAIDGKFIDEEKKQILLNEGYKITIKFNDMGTYPTYVILWDNNDSSIVIPSVDYILVLSTTGSSLSNTYDFLKTNIYKSGTTFYSQTTEPTTPLSGFTLYSNSTNNLSWKGANGYTITLSGSSNTVNRTYTLQNSSGTIPLLEATQTWVGDNQIGDGDIGKLKFKKGTISNTGYIEFLSNTNTRRMYIGYGTSTFNEINSDLGTGLKINTNGNIHTFFANGNVGIGTTIDTGYKVEVNGSLRAKTSVYFGNLGNQNGSIFIDGSGGIGCKILFNSNAIIQNVGGLNEILAFSTFGQTANHDFVTNAVSRMRIYDTGINIGGTTSPTSKLQVSSGNIEIDNSANGIILKSPDGSRYLIKVANGGTLTATQI